MSSTDTSLEIGEHDDTHPSDNRANSSEDMSYYSDDTFTHPLLHYRDQRVTTFSLPGITVDKSHSDSSRVALRWKFNT